MLRYLGRLVFLCAVAPAIFAAPVARHIIPSSAPRGARFVVTGAGLDDPSVAIAFSDGNGGSVAALIITRAATFIEANVPLSAATGTVTVSDGGSVVATLPFTVSPDPPFVRTATIAASRQAHDLFDQPSGAAIVTPSGAIYVSDTLHDQIKVIAPDGTTLSVIGSGHPGFVDGSASAAQFKEPLGLAFDPARNVIYVADSGNNAVRAIAADGSVTTLAGSGRPELVDGSGTLAGFKSPAGVAVDANGNVYVADAGNNAIRMIALSVVSTIAGGVHDGFADGPAAQALFKQPSAIAVDSQGTLYIADTRNNRIRKISAGIVSTVAGTGHGSLLDGSAAVAEFKGPSGIAIDDAGNLLIADTDNNAIRKISIGNPTATVSTIAGSGKPGYADGDPAASLFNQPAGVDMQGALAVADSMNDALRFIYTSIQVSGVDPRRGPLGGGNAVRIFGTGFVPGATQVTFGSNTAIAITFVTSTELLVTVPPAAAGSVDINVTTPVGSVTLAAAYTYLPPPVISTITPHKGKTTGGDSVTISGSYFADDGDTTVTIGGSAASVTFNDPTSLALITPPGTPGPADVVVTTPGGTTTQSGGFIYFAPPVITSFAPAQGGTGTSVAIAGSNFDPDSTGDQVLFGTLTATISSATSTQLTVTVPPGAVTGTITVTTAGGSVVSTTAFVVATFTGLSITSPATTLDAGTSVQFNAIGNLISGASVDVTSKAIWTSNSSACSVTSGGLVTAVAAGPADITASLGGFAATVHVTANAVALPPSPSIVAPRIDPTVVGLFADEISFLYSGPNPIQTGVAPNTIADNRAAVIRGKVMTLAGDALPAVHVSVAGHPEFGQTLSRADGMFDFAINGGGALTFQFMKAGFISAQRNVATKWGQQKTIADVALTAFDPQVTAITLGASTDQVARGSAIIDADGTRQATLVVPAATAASIIMPDGSSQPAAGLHVRATEFTVGPNGPNAMPALLPPQTGYTYCVELSADEAVTAGAAAVQFSKPLGFYVENFLNIPVGTAVPVGYYDRTKGSWVASSNGVVLKILSIANGTAAIDLNGDGIPDNPSSIGIDASELQMLAMLYSAGQTLWRIPVTHFTPYDANYSVSLPGDATTPSGNASETPAPSSCDTCGEKPGNSIVNGFIQTLVESIPIVGTPYSLEYASSRSARTQYKVTINLGNSVPASASRIELGIGIAGQFKTLTFPPQPNQTYDFVWDGTDAYGRAVQGAREASITIGYVYPNAYGTTGAVIAGPIWGIAPNVPLTSARTRSGTETSLTQTINVNLGHVDATQAAALGGWSLSPQRFYDPHGQTIYDAGGEQRSGDPYQTQRMALITIAGNKNCCYSGDGGPATQAELNYPSNIAAAPDGSIYMVDFNGRVRKVDPLGIISTILPAGSIGNSGGGIAVGPDGTVYVGDFIAERVSKIVGNTLVTVAGGGHNTVAVPVNVPATDLAVSPGYISAGADGSLYISDDNRVLRVTPDGLATSIIGFATLSVAAAPDGTVYATDENFVYRVPASGVVTVYAGNTDPGAPTLVDGAPATSGTFPGIPGGMDVAPDGTLILSLQSGEVIYSITPDGIAHQLIGNRTIPNFFAPLVDGILARSAPSAPSDARVTPDGGIVFPDQDLDVIRKATNVFPLGARGNSPIPSPDASLAYIFTNGRHTQTASTLTGATLLTLGYDAKGALVSLTDADGNQTSIARDANGSPLSITSPGGQQTTLTMSGGKLSAVQDPAGQTVRLDYDPSSGLLSQLTDARGGQHNYSYDANGLLALDHGPDGSFIAFTRSGIGNNYTVRATSAEGRVETYASGVNPDTSDRRNYTAPDGTTSHATFADANTTTITAEGATIGESTTADPRFGMVSPLFTGGSIAAGGQTMTTTHTQSILTAPGNPLAVAQMSESATINGRQWTLGYDGSTRSATLTSPAGRTQTTTVDGRGRLTALSTPGLRASAISYNSIGAIGSIQQGTRTTSFAYDPRQQLASITDPLGRVVQFAYDDAGRVISQTLPDQRVIGFTYDANGNLTSVTPPSRPDHFFTFTPGDLMAGYTPPAVTSGGATTYSYNLDRQLTAINRPDGSTIGVGYDAFGRPSTVSIARGKYTYGYDGTTGQLTSVIAPDGGSLAYAYSGPLLSRVTWSGTVAGSVSFAYDNNFRLASETAAGSAITFGYDADGLLITAGALTMTRDPQNGLLTGSTLGSITDGWTYNGFAEPLSYTASAAGNPILSEQYTRNDAGQIVQKNETILGTTHSYAYSYDTAGRLTGVTTDGSATASYSYDANSNRLPGTYDDQDRMLAYGGATYTYTAAGELATKTVFGSTTSYSYDELGNLTHVALPNGEVIDYVIDGQNRRVGKKIDGVLVRQWLYGDALRIVAELDGTGGLISRFVYGSRANVPDSMIRGGVTYRIISDHLGSPRLIVNTADGTIAEHLDYDAFGVVQTDTNPGFTPFGFAGGLYDPDTSLVRFGARDYDASTGRWTVTDPVLFHGGEADLYSYAGGDPVNSSDETGSAVLVGVHPALVPGDPENHTAIVLRPDNPGDFATQPWFAATKGQQATIGGQAFGGGTNYTWWPMPFGRLHSVPNYPGDNPHNLSHLTPVACPAHMTDTQFINAIINAASRYDDNAPYDPWPNRMGPYYNSNSYAAGVIRAAGGTAPPLPDVPGYDKPLPIH